MRYFLFLYLFCFSLSLSSKGNFKDTVSYNLCNDTIPVSIGFNDTIVFKALVNAVISDSVFLKPVGEIIKYTGRFFLETPYGSPHRIPSASDKLLVCFEKFDCVTFVETIMALTQIFKQNKFEFCDFANELKRIRYRHGMMSKFPSRLHYFSEWVYDNESKKIVEDYSGKIDTILWSKKINFMTGHKKKYRELKDTSYFNQTKKIEKELSKRKKYFLQKENIDKYKDKIKTGDILVLTVNTVGLDVSHTGFAIWIENDLYFMHASSSKHKVTITKVPFKEYLLSNKKITGFLVARPL